MLIDDIAAAELHYPLKNWVLWAKTANVIGIGYPRFSPSCREHQSKAGDTWEPPSSTIDEDEAERIDSIILELPADLLSVVRVHYLKPGDAKAKIAKLRMAKATFYDKLHSARRIIYVAFVSKMEA